MDIQEITNIKNKILLTSIGSTLEVTIQHPLTIIKNKVQNNIDPRTLHFRQFYAGIYSNIVVSASLVSSQYLLYDLYMNKLNLREYNSSILCGITLSTFITPLELYTLQKCKRFNQITSFNLMKELTINKQLLRGYTMCSGRELLFSLGLLVFNPQLKTYFDNNLYNNSSVYSSITSGVITSVLSHPFDTVKSKMQYNLNDNICNIIKICSLKIFLKGVFLELHEIHVRFLLF